MSGNQARVYINALRIGEAAHASEYGLSPTYAKNCRYYFSVIKSKTERLLQPFQTYGEMRDLAQLLNDGNCHNYIKQELGKTGYSYKQIAKRLEYIKSRVTSEQFQQGKIYLPKIESSQTDWDSMNTTLVDYFLLLRAANICSIDDFKRISTHEDYSIVAEFSAAFSSIVGDFVRFNASIASAIILNLESTDQQIIQIQDEMSIDKELVSNSMVHLADQVMAAINIWENADAPN